MLKDIQITKKFPIIMITFALISALATGAIAFTKTASSMELAAQEKLKSLLASRKSALTQYFDSTIYEVGFQGKNPLIIDAIEDLNQAWMSLGAGQEEKLRTLYIEKNPFEASKRHLYLNADDNSQYSFFHRKKHPLLSTLTNIDSYYDLFLINTQGDLIYSVDKEIDFATNLKTGPWRETQLARLFKRINDSPQIGKVLISDFAPYKPSFDAPASFIGTAVFNQASQYIGTIIFQLPIEPINRIMQVTAGMGTSGETYLVGEDLLMRSNSRFYKERSILSTQVDTPSVHRALAGETGFAIIDDYRAIPVYSAFSSFNVLSINWAILAEIDEQEVLLPVYDMSNFLMISGILIALAISVFGYVLSTDISKPIVAMTGMMQQLSDNDLQVNISVDERKDEIGKMAQAMVVFKQNAIERESLRKELIKIADVDSLTSLFTRKFAIDKLNELLYTADFLKQKLALMFIDVDDFKKINDSYGHDIGDKTLQNVASHISANVRKEDIVARIGGDEFIIILPGINHIKEVSPIAIAILASLVKHPFPISLSIGISIYPDNASNATQLLKKADDAMYTVKGTGKNNFSYWKPTYKRSDNYFS
jgi:diguanylate cyclase (GGDEF)-like protein